MNRISTGNIIYAWQPGLIEASYLTRIKMEIKTRVIKTVTTDLTITDVFGPAKQTAEKPMQKKFGLSTRTTQARIIQEKTFFDGHAD